MAEFEINSIIIMVIFCIIFGIFLFYDFFRKGERYSYLAYILAVLPVNYLWYLGFDALGVYVVLFVLWIICLLRDLLFVFRKTKEYDDILLFLILALLVQLIVTAILPADQLNPSLQENTFKLWFFYFPDIFTDAYDIEAWVNSSVLLGFRVSATFLIFLAILPMLMDLKDSEEKIPLPMLIIITALFILPFMYLSYIWLPIAMGVLTLLFSVILFIILLLLTKEK